MNTVTIYLKPTQKAQRAKMFNHLLPGILLFWVGIESLIGNGGEHGAGALAYLNIVAGAAVIIAIVREFKKSDAHEHTLVAWVDVFAGVVLILEGLNHYHPGKIFQPALFYILAGIATVVLLGLLHSKLAKIPRVELDEIRLFMRTSPFKKIELLWKELSAIELKNPEVSFTVQGGYNKSISLRSVVNSQEVFTALKEHAAARQIKVTE